MVAPLRMDDIEEVNFRFACRVFNAAWIIAPSPIYFYLETLAWESSLQEELENPLMHAGYLFPLRFEELLFMNFSSLYDAVVDYIL